MLSSQQFANQASKMKSVLGGTSRVPASSRLGANKHFIPHTRSPRTAAQSSSYDSDAFVDLEGPGGLQNLINKQRQSPGAAAQHLEAIWASANAQVAAIGAAAASSATGVHHHEAGNKKEPKYRTIMLKVGLNNAIMLSVMDSRTCGQTC